MTHKRYNCFLNLFFIFAFTALRAQSLHPVKDNIACLWGLKNDSGRWVVPPKYTTLNANYKSVLLVMYNDKWGLLSAEGKELIPLEYDKLFPFIRYSNNRHNPTASITEVIATKDGKSGVLDLKGKVTIPFLYDAVWKNAHEEGYFYVSRDKKIGIRTYEKELLPCRYSYLRHFGEQNLFVAGSSDLNWGSDNSFNGKNIGIIKINGDTLIPCRFHSLTIPYRRSYTNDDYDYVQTEPVPEPLIVVRLADSTGLYSFDGKCLLEPKYKLIDVSRSYGYSQNFYDQYMPQKQIYAENAAIVFTHNGKFGFVTPGKGMLQPAVFDSVNMEMAFARTPMYYRVLRDRKWGLINADGTTHVAATFPPMKFLGGHIFISANNNSYREYDWRTKKIVGPSFQKIIEVHNAYLILVSGSEFYSNRKDTAVYRCKELAALPGDITIINPGDAIEGKGRQATKVEMNGISINNTSYLAIQTKKGRLLCNRNYKVVIPPGVYRSFDGLEDSQNIVVVTNNKNVGMIDSSGKIVVDTIFEAIGTQQVNGMILVKPWQRGNPTVTGHCAGGWALADSVGNLITEPVLSTNAMSDQSSRQFLMTGDGVGVFDVHHRKFIIPANFINGILTENGEFIMQTKDRLFLPFSFGGKQLTPHPWKGLLHVLADNEIIRYENDSTQYDDAWLLVNGDSLALLNRGLLELDRGSVLSQLYIYFGEASARDPEHENSRDYFYEWSKPVSADCPRLDIAGKKGHFPYYAVYPVGASIPSVAAVSTETLNINDSLVLRMIRRSAPTARYPFEPGYDHDCACYAADYERGSVSPPGDARRIREYPVSVYYRVVYRDEKCISLQILDNFHNSHYTSAIDKRYSNRSSFENYSIGKDRWHTLQLSDLFKPGYENLLLDELVVSIRKADSLEMDCHNPASFLEQCEGRFSLSEKGLWLYLNDSNGYEYIPLLIPWYRIKSIILQNSPVNAFLKK